MIRNGDGAKWQPWRSITNHLLKRTKWNALLGREIEVLLITNSLSYASYDLGNKDSLFTKPPGFMSFNILEHAAKHYFRNFRCRKGGNEYELLLITRTPHKTNIHYFKHLSLL